MNTAKIAVYLIMTLLAVVIFFALTGMNLRDPMPAVTRIIDWSVNLNRTLTVRVQTFFARVRVRLFGGTAMDLPDQPARNQGESPLQRLGQAIGRFFRRLFGNLQQGPREEFVDPINQ
jgi:hypothetical protein